MMKKKQVVAEQITDNKGSRIVKGCTCFLFVLFRRQLNARRHAPSKLVGASCSKFSQL